MPGTSKFNLDFGPSVSLLLIWWLKLNLYGLIKRLTKTKNFDLVVLLSSILSRWCTSLMHFLLSSSQSLVSLREEANSSHKPNQHRAEPYRSSDWWDVQKSLRAQSALHNGRSGHDPTAAQTPRKRQCQGSDNLPFFFSPMHLLKFLFWFSSFHTCFVYFMFLVISCIPVRLEPALKM